MVSWGWWGDIRVVSGIIGSNHDTHGTLYLTVSYTLQTAECTHSYSILSLNCDIYPTLPRRRNVLGQGCQGRLGAVRVEEDNREQPWQPSHTAAQVSLQASCYTFYKWQTVHNERSSLVAIVYENFTLQVDYRKNLCQRLFILSLSCGYSTVWRCSLLEACCRASIPLYS